MNLEGFEIENWGCIRRLSVTDLPAASVVVLHGPNGTGKTSIVEALRACLMDNKSTSTALGRGLPKLSTDKPRVSVTFRAQRKMWRITKKFGSKESTLESRTPNGPWTLETSDPTEAHERTVALVGSGDSSRGLQQLLWLTQNEFRLPKPKEFDHDVQSRLRQVLGVLQTPLDDRVHRRLQDAWSVWFDKRGRKGAPKLKGASSLALKREELQDKRLELERLEHEFHRFERLAQRASELEVQERDLVHQLQVCRQAQAQLQAEYEHSLTRLRDYEQAQQTWTACQKRLQEAEDRHSARARAEADAADAKNALASAQQHCLEAQQQLRAAESRRNELQHELQSLDLQRRHLQQRREAARQVKDRLMLATQLRKARVTLEHAEQLAVACETLRTELAAQPAPDDAQLKLLSHNRSRADRLRAELDAAAMKLTVRPQPGAPPLTVAIDGDAAILVPSTTDSAAPIAIQRQAQIEVPHWGRLEISRGSDVRGVQVIEDELGRLNQEFAEQAAWFGINPGDPEALDQLRHLSAQKATRNSRLVDLQKELQRFAPEGLDRLREDVAKLEKKLQLPLDVAAPSPDLPDTEADLERELQELNQTLVQLEDYAGQLEQELKNVITDIEGTPEQVDSEQGRRRTSVEAQRPGLRFRAEQAKILETQQAERARARRETLEGLPRQDQLLSEIRDAQEALAAAEHALHAAELTDIERTVEERLRSAREATTQMDLHLQQLRRELHTIAGELRSAEGLHQRRTAIASRVEQLAQETAREYLHAAAHNRLLELFEECREKQLGSVIQPIHDRVVRWLQLLRIGNYDGVRFNDNFLPETLVARTQALELPLDHESTGTIEQLGLMVRLALGATLSSADEPAVAVLDDPLTHSDHHRLVQMRGVLRSAAAGDPTSTPPAGPLQVLIFTCHPEWFAMEGATVIDLGNNTVLQRASLSIEKRGGLPAELHD